jgi:hypothetical protein
MSSADYQVGYPLYPPPASASSQDIASASSGIDFAQFIFHYNFLRNPSVQNTLSKITKYLATHTDLHDWDEDLSPDPVKRLGAFAKDELSRNQVDKADFMLAFNTVQEVKTTDSINVRRYVTRNSSDVASQLFPSTFDMV